MMVSDLLSTCFFFLFAIGSHESNAFTFHSSKKVATQLGSTTSNDLELLSSIREGLDEAGYTDEWDKSVQYLSNFLSEINNVEDQAEKINNEKAEMCLSDALGWKAWAKVTGIAKRFQKTQEPSLESLQKALDWLNDEDCPLQSSDGFDRNEYEKFLYQAIIDYPKIYLVEPDVQYKKVMGVAPRKFRESLPEYIMKDPNVLQVTFNCEDEGCQSECGSCWVTYAGRL